MRVHIELHAARGITGAGRRAHRTRAVTSMLIQTVFLIDAPTTVGVTEVQPKTPVNKYETSLTGEGASHIANMLLM